MKPNKLKLGAIALLTTAVPMGTLAVTTSCADAAKCHIKFVINEREGEIWKTGLVEVDVKPGTKFVEAPKPQVEKDYYTFLGWCTDQANPEETKWDNETTIPEGNVSLYPYFEASATGMWISASTKELPVFPDLSTQPLQPGADLHLHVDGCSNQKGDWYFTDPDDGHFTKTSPYIEFVGDSEDTESVHVRLKIDAVVPVGEIHVYAYSNAYRTKDMAQFTFRTVEPYKESKDVWYQQFKGKMPICHKIKESSLYDASNQYLEYYETPLDAVKDETHKLLKTDLNSNATIVFGNQLLEIKDNFLSGINGNICPRIFTTAYDDESVKSSLVKIGNNFLKNTDFTGYLLPFTWTSLIDIGDSFMEGCTNFRNTANEYILDGILAFPESLKTIGNNFLKGCSSFNSHVSLGGNVETIGDSFMEGCTSFSSTSTEKTSFGDGCIGLQQSIKSVGKNFLYNCPNFTGTVSLAQGVYDKIGDNFIASDEEMTNGYYVCLPEEDKIKFETKFPQQTTTPYRKYSIQSSTQKINDYESEFYYTSQYWIQVQFAPDIVGRSQRDITPENMKHSIFKFDFKLTSDLINKINEIKEGIVLSFDFATIEAGFAPIDYLPLKVEITHGGTTTSLNQNDDYKLIKMPKFHHKNDSIQTQVFMPSLLHIQQKSLPAELAVDDVVSISLTVQNPFIRHQIVQEVPTPVYISCIDGYIMPFKQLNF